MFGDVSYVEEAGYVGKNRRMVRCLCSCGDYFVTRLDGLRSGTVKTCPACSAKRVWKSTRKHGRPPEYQPWASMIQRCRNKNVPRFSNWGGRGISVCERWMNSFEAFLEDMGPRPSMKHRLDRIDNNGNYEPGNVRWATQSEQMRNTRRNVMIAYQGREACLADWSRTFGISAPTLKSRIQRLGTEKAMEMSDTSSIAFG